MLNKLRHSWRDLGCYQPGERFQKHYRQRRKGPRGAKRKLLKLGGGMLLIAFGLFMLPVPGPGSIILLAGAAVMAQESLMAARLLDWIELRARKLGAALLRQWRQSSWLVRAMLVLSGTGIAGIAIVIGYRMFFAP